MSTLTQTPISAAAVQAASLSATTDADGRFTLTQPSAPVGPLRTSVSASGYLTRETTIAWPRPDGGVQLDLISLAAPFSLPLYQQLVRGALESSELYDVYRWTTRPRVALHPYDDGGRPLPPEVLATIRAAVPRAIAAWSAGLFEGVTVEDIETPDWQEGWIVLHVLRSESSPHCGLESFRHRDGRIVTSRIELALENCGCGSRKISTNTVSHELAHALGFWHARGPYVLAPETSDTCDSFENEIITPVEAAHARIAYSRPPGNKDPDRDPEAFSSVKAVGLRQSRTLVCGRARR